MEVSTLLYILPNCAIEPFHKSVLCKAPAQRWLSACNIRCRQLANIQMLLPYGCLLFSRLCFPANLVCWRNLSLKVRLSGRCRSA